MRVLPRTPRGVGLLAGLTWLAACAALWWALPPAPRLAWQTPSESWPVGFVPDTGVLVTRAVEERDVVLNFWDTGNGQSFSRQASPGAHFTVTLVPGRRWVQAVMVSSDEDRLVVFDIDSGREVVSFTLAERDLVKPVAASPDGRLLAYADEVDGAWSVRVWDLAAARERCRLRPAFGPCTFSPDGSRLAYVADQPPLARWEEPGALPCRVRVYDLEAGRSSLELTGPAGCQCIGLHFSPDAHFLAANLLAHPGDDLGCCCWEVSSGARRFLERNRTARFPHDQPWFAIRNNPESWESDCVLSRRAYQDGEVLGQVELAPEDELMWDWLSPDGRLTMLCPPPVQPVAPSNPVVAWLWGQVTRWGAWPEPGPGIRILDTAKGHAVGEIPRRFPEVRYRTRFTPDSRSAVVVCPEAVEVWDIPPRKSLAWFLGLAALLALPPAWLGRRRIKKLRTLQVA